MELGSNKCPSETNWPSKRQFSFYFLFGYCSFVSLVYFLRFSTLIQLFLYFLFNFSFHSTVFVFFCFPFYVWCPLYSEAILPDPDHVSKIRSSSNVALNPYGKSAIVNGVVYVNGKIYGQVPKRHHYSNSSRSDSVYAAQQEQQYQSKSQHDTCSNAVTPADRKNMEFLMPQVPNAAGPTSTAATNRQMKNILHGPGLTLNDIKSHLTENFQLIQSTNGTAAQQKMTKKQLKLAQAQLDKLTQINIHLHGMSN